MKTTLAIVFTAGMLTGCATTGDPTQGGLFGWSESKAQDRLAERQRTLRNIESDTAATRSQSQRLERQLP